MERYEGVRGVKRAIWGVFLIGLGVLFLLERTGTWGFHGLEAWWPLILIVVGITRAVEGRFGAAVGWVLLGAWFLAVTSHWHGLTYLNSWPLILIAVGVSIVLKALTGEDRRRRRLEGGLS
jgi:hypothetical protein